MLNEFFSFEVPSSRFTTLVLDLWFFVHDNCSGVPWSDAGKDLACSLDAGKEPVSIVSANSLLFSEFPDTLSAPSAVILGWGLLVVDRLI
jgi:hypothetical protein